jgi:hypothetical protein
MTTVNAIKNVDESFSIKIPDFVENLPPTGELYAYCRIFDSINITAGISIYTIGDTAPLVLSSPILTMTPTGITVGPSNVQVYTTVADCYLQKNGDFTATYTELGWGSQ